jgi:hypothetical protein
VILEQSWLSLTRNPVRRRARISSKRQGAIDFAGPGTGLISSPYFILLVVFRPIVYFGPKVRCTLTATPFPITNTHSQYTVSQFPSKKRYTVSQIVEIHTYIRQYSSHGNFPLTTVRTLIVIMEHNTIRPAINGAEVALSRTLRASQTSLPSLRPVAGTSSSSRLHTHTHEPSILLPPAGTPGSSGWWHVTTVA